MLSFPLPTDRLDWERSFPDYQTRWLAYCAHLCVHPIIPRPFEFVSWMRGKIAEFRAVEGIASGEFTSAQQDKFSAYLWGQR